jgi:hypothetical protein
MNAITKLKGLQHLAFTNISMMDVDYPSLYSLSQLTLLKSLDLSDNLISDKVIASIAPALRQLTSLEDLNLNGNLISDKGVTTLTVTVLPLLPALRSLHLNANSVEIKGVKALLRVATLQHIHVIIGNDFKTEALKKAENFHKLAISQEHECLYTFLGARGKTFAGRFLDFDGDHAIMWGVVLMLVSNRI